MSAHSAGSLGGPAAPPRKSLRILYADDVRELREVARIALTREGHTIECVADGSLARDRLARDAAFDLLITDHHMPSMNGLELVGWVRLQAFRGKILVFCSELDPKVAGEYRALQVDAILYKPVYPSTLRATLAALFAPDARG
jgi:CheY-like chemotaxis protein